MRDLVPLVGAFGLLLMYQGMTGWRPPVRWRRLREAVDAAGIPWLTPARLVALSIGSGALVGIIVTGLTGTLTVSIASASMVMFLPSSWARSLGRKRATRFREEWPDAIATLIAGIRGGRSLAEACVNVTQRSGVGLRPGFEAFTRTYRASGNFVAALDEMRSVLADPIADRVAVALGSAHSVGGTDLVRVLRALADFVRGDLQARREVEARWSWTITAAKLAAGAPWMVLLIMSLRPEAAASYSSGSGVVVLGLGGAATLLGYRLMLRAGRLPAERRLHG